VTNEESSINRQNSHSPSPTESRLQHGGLTGLQNLGNTVSLFFFVFNKKYKSNNLIFLFKCFMNSVLQCLSNTKPLLLFCFKDNLTEYLNTSSTSVMKGVLMRGKQNLLFFFYIKFSIEYASLIRKMWTSSDGHSIVSPSSFKNTVGRFAPRFLGYAYVKLIH